MKKIVIICTLDGFANSGLPVEIQSYLEKKGHDVTMVNTIHLNKIILGDRHLQKGPSVWFALALNFFVTALLVLQERYARWTKKYLYYYLITTNMKCRGYLLHVYFEHHKFDLIIGESQADSKFFLYRQNCKTLYHCATPWADELYYGGELTKRQYEKFLDLELRIYKSVTYLAFHWYVYADYVKKYYYKGDNLFPLDSGCTVKEYSAKFRSPPRIVYLGYLGGYWINLSLLSRLAKIYPHIDVYGAPPPPKKYGLNYKGYASPEILSAYQFGLITISKDRLRKEGFSAKHMEYLSYGLPVLMPEWRQNAKHVKGTIMYNEKNFKEVVKKYSAKDAWTKVSRDARRQAQYYNWDAVLEPLSRILKTL